MFKLEDRLLFSGSPAPAELPADAQPDAQDTPIDQADAPIELSDADAATFEMMIEGPDGEAAEERLPEGPSGGSPTVADIGHTVDPTRLDDPVARISTLDMHLEGLDEGGPLLPTTAQDSIRHELLVVDGKLPDPQGLADQMVSSKGQGVEFEILVLDSTSDALTQISAYLDGQAGLGQRFDAVHLVTHGQQGVLQFGATSLRAQDFAAGSAQADQLAGWAASLTENADILLYGCEVGAGDGGLRLLENLSRATGADVAASTDKTGSEHLGGDWVLESRVGVIETTTLASPLNVLLPGGAKPTVSISAPDAQVGETIDVTVTFDNSDTTDARFGPWVDVFIDATGRDGIVDPANPGNIHTGDTDGIADPGDFYDGFTLTGTPTYLGANVKYTLLVLDDTANGGLGVAHPYAVDTSGSPVYVSTSNPLSPYFAILNGKYTTGDRLLVMELPFGSFTPDQPVAEINFRLSLSDHADVNQPLRLDAVGGFRFGNDPLANPATDPSIIGVSASDSVNVAVSLATLTKTYSGPENETATGPNYLRTYRINVDIAEGQTFSDLHIFDQLPDYLQFVQISAASHAYTALSTPSTTSTGGDLGLRFNSPIVGGSGSSDAWVEVQFYVPRVYDSNGNGSIGAGDAPVLQPNSGADRLVDNQAYGFGQWTPIDPRDSAVIVGLQVDTATFDPTDLTTALATAAPDADFEHEDLEVSPLVIQKNFTTTTDAGASGHTAGDVLQFTLDFQVSDYYAFQNLVVADTLFDGLRFDSTFVPTLQINGNTFVLTAAGWASANYTVTQDFTPKVSDPLAVGPQFVDASGGANSGSTFLEFRISDEMVTRGGDGNLIGGGINPLAPTGNIANNLSGYNDGATTGRITYRAVILDKFADAYPSGEDALNPRDELNNTVTITGEVLDLNTGAPLDPYAGPVISTDDSAEGLTIRNDVVEKTIYAINGNTNLSLFQDTEGRINIKPGDVVTYRFTYSIPSGDVENLRFTDFLPLPIFDVDDINADNTAGGIGEWSFDDNTANVAVSNFTPGVITYGPTHSLHTVTEPAPATPSLSIDSITNSVSMVWGDFINTTNGSKQVDILISATVSSDPFADALFLTNQVQSGEGNTQSPGTESLANAIIQVVLNQPLILGIHKGVVASTQGGSIGTVGGLTFDTVGGAGFTGTLVGESNAALIGALNLDAATDVDAGDLVRFALAAVNSGRSDAYDVKFQDTIVGSYVNNYADKTAFMSATNFKVLRGDGTLLTEGTDYTLVWNNVTKTFEVELADNYTAGNVGGETRPGGLSRGYDPSIDAEITNGSNAVVVLYDLTVDTDAQASSTVTNTVTLTNYAGDEGATDHTAEDKTDDASVVIASPGFTKVFTSTSVTTAQDPNNALNQAVIGEIVTYTLTVTVGEGTTAGAVITDTMDAGLSFVDVVSTTYSSGVSSANTVGSGANPSNVTIGNSGGGTANSLVFDFGDITNTNIDNATAETITIVYRTVVVDTNTVPSSPGNQAGTQLNNSASFEWEWNNDPDDPLVSNPEGTGTLLASTAVVTVIEPVLTLDLAASATVGGTYSDSLNTVDAGDNVFYRIRITNAVGGPSAFDIDLASVLPSQLGSLAVVSTTLSNASGGAGGTIVVTDGGPNTLDVSDFVFTGSTLGLALSRNIDLGANSRLEIIVQGTLDYTVNPNQQLTNSASVTWTSLDGSSGSVSTHNPAGVERTGAGGPGTDAAVLDNYSVSDPTTVTITVPANAKSIVATSEDFTTVVSGTERVAVGEIVRYRLVVTLPEGTSPDLQIVDNLPTGMVFINDGTAMVGFVSAANNISSTTISGAGLDLGGSIGQPTLALSDTAVSTNAASNGDNYNSGTDVRFKLGTVTNSANSNGTAEYVVIEFNALVLNTAGTGNQNNTLLANNFTSAINGSTQVGAVSNTVNARVAEANLTVGKTTSATLVDAGDTFSYTITITNNANTLFGQNAAPAFDVRLLDALDAVVAGNPTAELEFLSYSVSKPAYTSVLTDASSTATDTLDLTFNRLNPGDVITVTVNAQVKTGALAAAEIENKALVSYTSLPGISGTETGTIATDYATTNVDLNPGTDSVLANADANNGTVNLGASASERTGADSTATANDNTPPTNSSVRNNYAVAANAPAGLLVASPTIDKSFQNGSISADDTSVLSTTGAQVVIGETVAYDLLITLPEGVTGDVRVQDLVPAGLRIDSLQILTTAVSTTLLSADFNGSFATTPTLAAPVSGSSTLTFDFDNITVVDDNVATNNSFVIRLVATVENLLANQTGVTLANTARLVFNDPDGSGNAGPDADRTVTDSNTSNDPVVTIVEPTLDVNKSASAAPPVDAGDPVEYTITITNSSGQTAYDVTLSDPIAAQLVVSAGFLGTLPDSSVTPSGGATVSANAFEIADLGGGNFVVRTAAGANVDIPPGESVTLTFRATVSASVPPSFAIENVANARWTSTDGANPDERGGGDVADNAPTSIDQTSTSGPLNNYALSHTAVVTTVNNISVTKAVTDTSVDNDGAGGTNDGTATIGEIVTYTLTITLPEGTSPDFRIRDNIPAGMAYVPGSVSINTSGYVGSVSLPAVSPTSGVAFGDGQDIEFDFASIATTNDNITTNNTFTITYQAVVLDVGDRSPDGEANDGRGATTTTLVNTATHNNGDGTSFTLGAGSASVNVVEPDLQAVKSVVVNGSGASGDAGDPVVYTIIVSHQTGSNQAAYDLTFADTLPAQIGNTLTSALDMTGVVVTHSSAGDVTASFEIVGGVLQTKPSANLDLLPGETLTVTVTGVLVQSVPPGTSFDNQASFTYSTLDGDFSAPGFNPNSDLTTDRERISSETSNIVTVTVPSALAIAKSVIATSHTATGGTTGNDLAIGETATFRLNVTLEDGTTARATITDTTPAGLAYVAGGSGSGVFFRSADGVTVTGFNTNTVYTDGMEILAADLTDATSTTAPGTLEFRFKDLVAPGTSGIDTDSFQIEYTLRASNAAANQAETSPNKINSAQIAADRNGDGDTTDPGETATDTATVVIKEPVLELAKTTTTTGSDSGDTVVYTLTITNNGNSTAYEVNILDTLDTELELVTPGSALAFSGTPPAYVTLDQTGNTASAVASVLNELRPGDSVTITITARITADANPLDIITNSASLTYSSLPGTDAAERDGSGGVNDYTDSASSTQFQLAAPTITKSLVSTSDANTGTSQHNGSRTDLAIGEIVTYTVTVTFTEGVTSAVTISDIGQDNGTAVLEILTAQVSAVGANLSATGGTHALSVGTSLTPGNAGGSSFADTAAFNFGTVTNSFDNASSGADQAVITVTARVANHLNNQSADAVQNTGRLEYTDGQGSAQTLNSNVSVDVVEPRVTVAKSVTSATTGLDAGDSVTYSVTIDNLAANGATGPAYDVTLADVLPAGMLISSISAPTLSGGATVETALAGTGGNNLTGIFDIPLGGSVTFTFTATLPDSVTPGQVLTSDLNVTFSSQDGVVSGERTGAGVTDPEDNTPPTNNSILNNYAVGADVSITTVNPFTVTKTLSNTSAGNDTAADVLVGEILTYQLEVAVMEGITSSLSLVDTLPAGVSYVPSSVLITNANGITINGLSVSIVGQTLTITATSVENPGGSNATTNDPATSETDSFFLTYLARVDNVADNQNGTTLTNSVDGTGTGVPPDLINEVTVTVIEPDLAVDKTIVSPTANLDAGDVVTYQITVSHTGTSAADAYELILSDTLPGVLGNYTLISAVIGVADVSPAFNLTVGGVLSTVGDVDLALGQTLVLTVSGTLKDSNVPGTSFTNTVDLAWSSLDGGLDGDDAGTIDERTGGGSNPPNDYTDSDNVSAVTVGTLGVAKAVDKATATIGEEVTYTVTVTVAEGTTTINLSDTLPSGVALVAGSAVLNTPSGWTITGFNTGTASQTLTVTNPGTVDNGATLDSASFTYTYKAVVTNTLPNQAGTTLVNDLDASADLNNDGDTTDPGETDNNNTATTTVVEPRVFIDKTATPVSGLNAGDTITYTVVLTNPNSAATSTAFDVVLTDTVPAGLLITSITSTTLAGGATTDSAVSITGGGTGLTGQFDIPVDGSVTVVYTAVLQTSLVPGQSLVNDADASFTSLDGTVTGERTGGDITEPTDNTHPDEGTTLNNYGVGDEITVTAISYEPLVNKSIVSTSEAGSTGTDVLVGEIVRFRLKFELFEGTLNDLVIQDYLPAELQFLNDGTASFSTVNVATTVTGASLVIADSLTGSGTTFGNGTDIFFQLGDVVNNDNDADVEYGVIEFNAIVLNTAANQEAVTRTNNFGVYYDADNSGAVDASPLNTLRVDANDDGTPESTGQNVSNSVTVTVREAALAFNQTIPAGTGYDAGDTFSITYTITNSGSVPAYNVRLADLVLPAEFDLTNISFVTTGTGGTVTDSTDLGADSIDAEISQMAAGSTWTITATVTLRDSVNPSDVYTNPAGVTFTSLPGSNGTTGNATGSDTPGAAGSPTGERTGADGIGGALNDYALTDTEGLSIPNPFSVTKAADKTTASIGEIVTYTVQVTVIEGTTTNIVLNDTLPAGMVFVANSATLTNASGMTITGFNANSLDQTLTSVVNPGANEGSSNSTTATDTFTYTYQARVQNVVGNQSGTILTNDLDGSGDGVPPDEDNQVDVEVVEPDLNIAKTITSPTANLDAGDTVTYQIVVNHTGASRASAFDLILNDTFPSDLENITLVSAVVRDGVNADIDVASTGTNEIQLGGGTLTSTGSLDLLRNTGGAGFHQQLVITVSGTVKNATDVGRTITNSATVLWSSLDGGLDGDDNGNTDERTGGGGNPPNDYNDSDSVQTVTKGVLNVSKAADVTEATIGDIVTYTVTFEVAAGRTVVNWADSLPAGMALVSNSVAVGSNPDGLSITGLNNNALTGQTITVVSTGTRGDEAATLETSTFTVTYQAVVLDVPSNDGLASAADGDGQTDLVNSVDASADLNDDGDTGDTGEKDEDNEATVRVIEPRVIITKSNNDLDGVVVPGQVVTYTLTLENLSANGSTAVAYDVRVRDLLPPSLTLTIGSINVAGATVASNSSAGNTLDLTLSSLALDATATVSFTATVGTGATGGTNIDNNAKIFYDTQAGDEGTAPGTGNTVFGETDGPTGDRDYGSTGPDEAPTPVTDDPHQDTDRLTVGNYSLGDRVWFDLNGDGVQDGSEIGIGGVTVTLLYAGNDGIFGNGDDVNLGSVDTDAGTGNYLFSNLADGNYRVTVDANDLPDGAATIRTFDLDGTGTPHVAETTLSGTGILTVDFGYRGSSSISDTIYFDANNDGDQDAGEVGLSGIDLTARWAGDDGIFDTSDDLVLSTTTDANGNYSFNDLFSGDYRVDVDQADLPGGIDILTSGTGSVGADPYALALGAAENNLAVDFGYRGPGSLGDTVWYDVNADGILNGAEIGISGVTVELTWAGLDGDFSTTADNLVLTDITDAAGNYSFTNLAVDIAGGINTGLHRVAVITSTLPAGFTAPTFDLDGTGTPDMATLTIAATTPNRTDVDFGYRGTGALGNRVYHDTNGNGAFDAGDLGLGNIDVNLRWAGQDGTFDTADDVTYSTTTDTSGNYGFADLVAGDFRVDIDNADLPAGITTLTAGVSGSDLSVGVDPFTTNLSSGEDDQAVDFGYRGTGSLGDKVFADIDGDGTEDAIDYGLPGVGITLTWAGLDGDFSTTADNVVYTTTTDANGNYLVGNLAPGNYRAAVDTGTLPAGYTNQTYDLDGTGTASTADLTLTNGQNRTDADFGYKGNARIADTVWLDLDGDGTINNLEKGIGNVTLDLIFDVNNDGVFDGGDVVIATTSSDPDGLYEFNGLVPDRYLVRVTDTNNVLTSATSTFDKDDYGTAADNGLATVDLSPDEDDAGVDFGYRGAASLGDRVWNDRNNDGVQDSGEFGIPGATLNLFRDLNGDGDYADTGEGQIATTTSGVNGTYLFEGLIGGNYIVEVANPPASSTNSFDKDEFGTTAFDSSAKVILSSAESDLTVDFGYLGQASIGDYVWYDANQDGNQTGEPPLPGIRVFLDIDGNGNFDSATDPSAITDASGFYQITGLIGGTYTARVDTSTLPAGYVPTADRDGSGSAHLTSFVLGDTDALDDVDFGYVGTITVSGRSYHDLDKNNLFDGADTGLGGVVIELILDVNNDGTVDGGDFVIFTDTTAADGTYEFNDVLAGDYLIRETQLAGYGSSQNATNLIDIAVTASGSAGNNFGNTTGSIAGRVFLDTDDNGLQDSGESGIENVSVTLEWSGGDSVFGTSDDRSVTVLTDANGDYLFDFSNTAGFVANGDSTRGLLSTGSYRILGSQPAPYLDGAETVGDASVAAGTIQNGTAPAGRGADEIYGIQIADAQDAVGYNFAEIPPSSISGSVHVDNNNNGIRDTLEQGIRDIEITLTGLDAWGRTVSLTTTTDSDGNFSFTGLYAGDKNGYTLEQPTQPPGFYDGLEGIGVGGVGGAVDVEFILNIPLGYGVDAADYTFGEIPIPPVVPPTPEVTEILEEVVPEPGVLDGYFYNTFENFLPGNEEEDEENPFLAEPGIDPAPLLPITPIYSGHAEPGSTVTVELRNIEGSVVGTETVVADAGGAWLAKFPSNIVYDVPTTVVQTVTRPTHSDRVHDDFNFRTFFAPTLNPSHFFAQPFDIDRVISESSGRHEMMIESLGGIHSFEWEGHQFEFLAQPGLPSS